jgi:hypothetical protein
MGLSIIFFRLTKTMAESSRIQTMKFFEREQIKQQIIRQRDQVIRDIYFIYSTLETERAEECKEVLEQQE